MTTRKPFRFEAIVLHLLDEKAGRVTGHIVELIGRTRSCKNSAQLRQDLLRMQRAGWVAPMDDQKPVVWVRTPLGTDVLKAWEAVS